MHGTWPYRPCGALEPLARQEVFQDAESCGCTCKSACSTYACRLPNTRKGLVAFADVSAKMRNATSNSVQRNGCSRVMLEGYAMPSWTRCKLRPRHKKKKAVASEHKRPQKTGPFQQWAQQPPKIGPFQQRPQKIGPFQKLRTTDLNSRPFQNGRKCTQKLGTWRVWALRATAGAG